MYCNSWDLNSRKGQNGLNGCFENELFYTKSIIRSELYEFAYNPVVFIIACLSLTFTSSTLRAAKVVYVLCLLCATCLFSIAHNVSWLNTSWVNKVRKQYPRYSWNISWHNRNDKDKQFTAKY